VNTNINSYYCRNIEEPPLWIGPQRKSRINAARTAASAFDSQAPGKRRERILISAVTQTKTRSSGSGFGNSSLIIPAICWGFNFSGTRLSYSPVLISTSRKRFYSPRQGKGSTLRLPSADNHAIRSGMAREPAGSWWSSITGEAAVCRSFQGSGRVQKTLRDRREAESRTSAGL
jgi:hypothetical protein